MIAKITQKNTKSPSYSGINSTDRRLLHFYLPFLFLLFINARTFQRCRRRHSPFHILMTSSIHRGWLLRHRSRLLSSLGRLDFFGTLQPPILHEDTTNQTYRRDRRIEYEHRATRLLVGIEDSVRVGRVVKRVIRLRVRAVRQVLKLRWQRRPQRVLQDGCTDGQADGAAQAAEEVADGDDDGALRLGRVGLQRDDGGLEDVAVANAHHDQNKHVAVDGDRAVEERGERGGGGEQDEAEPDALAVPLAASDVLAGTDGGDGLGDHERDGEIGGLDGREAPHVLVVERQVVEIAVEDDAKEKVLDEN